MKRYVLIKPMKDIKALKPLRNNPLSGGISPINRMEALIIGNTIDQKTKYNPAILEATIRI